MRSYSDEQLVAIARTTQTRSAYEELARRHTSGLEAFIEALGRSDIDAGDVAQTALLKGFRNIKKFEGRSSFRTWLFKIGYREFLRTVDKLQRSEARRRTIAEKTPIEPEFLNHDERLDLMRALQALSEKERTSLILCDAFEFTHREAAIAMETPLGSVKTYVSRARRLVKEYLEKET